MKETISGVHLAWFNLLPIPSGSPHILLLTLTISSSHHHDETESWIKSLFMFNLSDNHTTNINTINENALSCHSIKTHHIIYRYTYKLYSLYVLWPRQLLFYLFYLSPTHLLSNVSVFLHPSCHQIFLTSFTLPTLTVRLHGWTICSRVSREGALCVYTSFSFSSSFSSIQLLQQ